MELLNLLQRYGRGEGEGAARRVWAEALDALLCCWRPMAPHVTAELWERRHPREASVHAQSWPAFDPELVAPGDA